MEANNKFLERTRLEWQAYSGKSLTLEDAREINYNLLAFFKLLDKWDKESCASVQTEIGGTK